MLANYPLLTNKLCDVVKETPDRVALQIKKPYGYEKYTYQELYKHAQNVARTLQKKGIQKGDRVAIVLENRPEWVFIYFGILIAGAIAVPLDSQSTLEELSYFFEDSASKIIFTSSKFQALVSKSSANIRPLPELVVLDSERSAKTWFFDNATQLLKEVGISASDTASILYTSGTTGKPKGVILTHKNFYANFSSIEQLNIFNAKQNVLSILPLHHALPFMVNLLIPIFYHSTITYLDNNKQEEITQCMRETGVTIFVGVPEFYYLFYQTISNKINQLPWPIPKILWPVLNIFYKVKQYTPINLNKLLCAKIHTIFGPIER